MEHCTQGGREGGRAAAVQACTRCSGSAGVSGRRTACQARDASPFPRATRTSGAVSQPRARWRGAVRAGAAGAARTLRREAHARRFFGVVLAERDAQREHAALPGRLVGTEDGRRPDEHCAPRRRSGAWRAGARARGARPAGQLSEASGGCGGCAAARRSRGPRHARRGTPRRVGRAGLAGRAAGGAALRPCRRVARRAKSPDRKPHDEPEPKQ